MQNELNSDVARFTTHEKNLATSFAARHVRKKVVKRATMLQSKLHVFCWSFYCSFKEKALLSDAS